MNQARFSQGYATLSDIYYRNDKLASSLVWKIAWIFNVIIHVTPTYMIIVNSLQWYRPEDVDLLCTVNLEIHRYKLIRARFGGVTDRKGGWPKSISDPFSAPKAPKIVKSNPLLGQKNVDFGHFLKILDILENFLPKTQKLYFGNLRIEPDWFFWKLIRDKTPGPPLLNRSMIHTYTYAYILT